MSKFLERFTAICACISVILLMIYAFNSYNNQNQFDGFVVIKREYIDNDIEQLIMYDPDTLIMYSYIKTMYSGGLTIIYNDDNSPKLYSVSG